MNELLYHVVQAGHPSDGGVKPFAAAEGETPFYTCPCARQMVISAMIVVNPTSGPISWHASVVLGGVLYQTTADRTVLPGRQDSVSRPFPILSSQQGASFQASAEGLVVTPCVYEFDKSRWVRSAFLPAFAAGDNPLASVPGGRSACIFTAGDPLAGGLVIYYNGTTGTCTVQPKLNGLPVAPAVSVGAGAQGLFHVMPCLNARDAVALSSDSGAPGQVAWVDWIEAQG